MEALVKNLSSTVELLAVAVHSDTVAQWDEETLSRAFQWALYCQHIHDRFHHSPVIRKVMETQLEMTNESLASVFPHYRALCFRDLAQCQNLFLNGLLHNAHLPVSITNILFDKPKHISHDGNSYQDARGLCSSVIECKSACKVLVNVNIPSSTTGPEAEVQAELLLEKLNAAVKQSSDEHTANVFLDSVLQGCEQEMENFCVVICAALQNESSMDMELTFILDWLESKSSLLEYMCHSVPLFLLADVAKKHLRFRNIYCDVLKKWAKEMEYDMNDRQWNPVSRNPSVSFQKLTEHFIYLFKASVSLKDYLETELKALKFTDGDFDVRGLSIWGDLLSDIFREMTLNP